MLFYTDIAVTGYSSYGGDGLAPTTPWGNCAEGSLCTKNVAITEDSINNQSALSTDMKKNCLYYGDNLEVLRKYIRDESVDLCYIDPPFNSKRTYNQIFNNLGVDAPDVGPSFCDTWVWNSDSIKGFEEIITNYGGRFSEQTVELIKGFKSVLKEGPLFAYLIGMTLRIVEIHRVLKPSGSFYLHCDPTSSHYLKLILDGVFCSKPGGGEFQNEIVWNYGPKATQHGGHFQRKHDTLFLYGKCPKPKFHEILGDYSEGSLAERKTRYKFSDEGGQYRLTTRRDPEGKKYRAKVYLNDGVLLHDVWNIGILNSTASERIGYATQKPETLLERVMIASSDEGDTVLDAYCGCGTTIAVAQRKNRRWIGIDITYRAISTILDRFKRDFPDLDLKNIELNGIPRDMKSAVALAHKRDDRVRKEFEKWAVLTYANNQAVVHEKKGADGGIDGLAYILTSATPTTARMIFQVKSGAVKRSDVATLKGDMQRENAELAVLITLQEPTANMLREAKACGLYKHELTGTYCDKIQIVPVRDIVENGRRLELPQNFEALKAALREAEGDQLALDLRAPTEQEEYRKPVAGETAISVRRRRVR